ncbi:MAG: polyphosphate polymerase domain-containing protein [Lachnospiraceae bacterium]|nr:polyphosphate polymerase domain-containing protein [Lachnospiraceae bacterium]
MAIEVFNRVEKKYLIDADTYERFCQAIEPYMNYDKHCVDGAFYSINNIYYDTDTDELIRRSIDKPPYKEKLRLRSYGVPELEDKVWLEIKKKFKGIVNKRRTLIRLYRAYDFVEKGIIPKASGYLNEQVVKELKYFIDFYNPKPKLFLKYDRIAMFGKEDSELRITFDTNITTRRYDLRLEAGQHGEKLLEEDMILMEIKTIDSLPLWLTNILTNFEIKSNSFSKYGTEYLKYIKNLKKGME